MHPWEKFNGTDSKHYPDFNYVVNSVLYGQEVFYPTEFMHGLFDGGHGAGLDDFWSEMRKHPYFSGGFLWSLHDEGVVRTDKGGIIDVAGNAAPDGIVGPHREKEASFYTIKEIWSPVYIATQTIPQQFDGRIAIENRYLYTNLDQCKFQWKAVAFALPNANDTAATIVAAGTAISPHLAPGEKGYLHLGAFDRQLADALYLTAYDANGKEVFTWSWALKEPGEIALKKFSTTNANNLQAKDDGKYFVVQCDGISYFFDETTGYLQKVNNGKTDISLGDGPVLAGTKQNLETFDHYRQDSLLVVEPTYKGDGYYHVKWIFQTGKVAQAAVQL